MESIKSQGTELFFVDEISASDPAIVQMTCPTGITGLNSPSDQIDTTCLTDTERTFVQGLKSPGQVTVPFVMKSPAPTNHQVLFDLRDSGDDVKWMMCLSDGTADPTLDLDDEFAAPAARTSFGFHGFISDISVDVASNEVVRGQMTVQRSGAIDITWKT